MRLCKYDTTITKNASVHVSMSLLYIYLGVLLVERVGYDFSVSLCASFSTSFHYSDDLRCLLYLFSFGHVFFRANANCRLYQTADSTETPLLAQVIVSSPGSPSSEESEASPEPINKSLLSGLGLEKNNEGATANSTGPGTEQITPTSSVDTEEGNIPHPEEGEKGVEGDAEASDDDRH